MDKTYSVMITGCDESLENGEFCYQEALFSSEEAANKVCEHLNLLLKEEAEDITVICDNIYYVNSYTYARYFVKENKIYESVEEYIKERNR